MLEQQCVEDHRKINMDLNMRMVEQMEVYRRTLHSNNDQAYN